MPRLPLFPANLYRHGAQISRNLKGEQGDKNLTFDTGSLNEMTKGLAGIQ